MSYTKVDSLLSSFFCCFLKFTQTNDNRAKCNRELPCESCIKRDERATCKYASNAIRNPKSRNSNVGERLKRVEKLVSELVGGSEVNEQVSVNQRGNVDENIQEGRRYRPRGSGGVTAAIERESPITRKTRGHIENTHWLSILDDIKEVREQLAQSDIMTSPEDDVDTHEEEQEEEEEEEIDLVLGATQPLPTFQEIINSLPPRPICDTLLSQYFTSPMVLPIIHTIKFQNEVNPPPKAVHEIMLLTTQYEKFWHNPTKAPPLWVGLLFSILACVASVQQAMLSTTETSNQQPALPVKPLRSKTVQCLIMGNYTNANSYALETLVMYLLGTYIGKPDSSFDGWFLMGTIIRLAMRMGYHRDPNTQTDSKITPFEGEMRRRRWHAILQLDTLISFQMGMPSMIPPEFCDTESPRNLNDEDIWPAIETLPPSRPSSDYTPALYTIAKVAVMNMFRKVLVHTHSSSSSSSSNPPSYPVTIDLDAKLRETYASIPETLKWRPINQSFTVSSGLIINRCTIELLYLKSVMVLHRRYLNTERHDPQREFSRRACINAALEVLARQTELHDATSGPHGRLYEDRWMVSSLTAHDFLLASMVICLELSVLMRSPSSLSPGKAGQGQVTSPHFSRLLDALLNSQRIWASKSAYSNEARTAALTLQLMIDKVQQNITTTFSSGEKHEPNNYNSKKKNQPPTAMESSSAHVHTDPQPRETEKETEAFNLPFAGTMTDMITGSENLDWALLDHYLQNTGSAMPPGPAPGHSGAGMYVPYDDEWGLLDVDMGMDVNMSMDASMNLDLGPDGQGHGQEIGYYQGYFG
ncbi:hypothetical protein TMatcc_010017 [Talaromyces marneffei ATCC 18224]